MDFFEAPPVPDEIFPDTPPWQAPPQDAIGEIVPLNVILARSRYAIVVLSHAAAYPSGCLLTLNVAARRAGMDVRDWALLDADFLAARGSLVPETRLNLGVRFQDGAKATIVGPMSRNRADESPAPPQLTVHWGGSASLGLSTKRLTRDLWLWPLPPPEPFELAVEWLLPGIPLTFVEVDGAALVAAAARSEPFWPGG